MAEDEVNWGRRAFGEAQALLAGDVARTASPEALVGWYDSAAHPESGSFAVVRADGAYADLVGDVLRVTNGERSCLVYVVDFANVDEDLAVYRRAFLHLGLLSRGSLPCLVEVLA